MKTPIQNHLKSSISEKRRSKAKYLTWNSIRFKFVRKASISDPVKEPWYIKCYSLIIPRPVKSPSNSIRCNCQKICSWSRRPKMIMKIRKKATFLLVINSSIIYKLFKYFTNHRKKVNMVVVFSLRPFPNILKYKDHQWDLPIISKIRLLQINN